MQPWAIPAPPRGLLPVCVCRGGGFMEGKTQNWARVMWWIPVWRFTTATYTLVWCCAEDSGDLDPERYAEEMQEGTVGDSSRNLSGKEYIALGRPGRKNGEVSPWTICLECDYSEREWREWVNAASIFLVWSSFICEMGHWFNLQGNLGVTQDLRGNGLGDWSFEQKLLGDNFLNLLLFYTRFLNKDI